MSVFDTKLWMLIRPISAMSSAVTLAHMIFASSSAPGVKAEMMSMLRKVFLPGFWCCGQHCQLHIAGNTNNSLFEECDDQSHLYFIMGTTKPMTIHWLNEKPGSGGECVRLNQFGVEWWVIWIVLFALLLVEASLQSTSFPANIIFRNVSKESGMYLSADSLDAILALDGYMTVWWF